MGELVECACEDNLANGNRSQIQSESPAFAQDIS